MTHPALVRDGVYAITNGPREDLMTRVEAALAGGARLLQYRDKTRDAPRRLAEARVLKTCCDRYGIPLIINDDVELAVASGAAGVHLGEDDSALAAARARLGPEAILGVSCYDDIERARMLAVGGADYLAFGAFFASPTKPLARHASSDLLRQAATLGLPLVAIGGITPDNGRPLVAAGARYLAVISAVFDAPDVCAATRRFTQLFPTDPS